MTRLVAGLGTLVFMLVSCSAALAVDYPRKTFDATYEVAGSTGNSTMRMSSDGKGKMRVENITPAAKVVTISDYPSLAAITILEAQKMAMKSKLTAESYQGSETEDMKKRGAKDLGSKEVAGHPCHGWEYTTPAAKSSTQTWIGNDIGWMVQSASQFPSGKSVVTLKTFSNKAPDAALFNMTPPAGFKVTGP
jgi:outer membrane lipoprotein-sorting protein